MRIEARCRTCEREFLLAQIGPESDAPGRCPFCGARFARHYGSLLVDAVGEAETASAEFVRSLGKLQALQSGFDIAFEKLMRDVRRRVVSDRPASKPGGARRS
jgi:DNA-directed RNA polymerase subunit RPC12/RpoP